MPKAECLPCGALLAGVVAAERADLQVFVAGPVRHDFHGAIARCGALVLLVADGVLVADVARDGLADAVNLARIFREERDAAGLLAQGAQGTLGALAVLVAKDADAVDRGAAL